jgi:YVTN family beta-propeller protein
VGPVGGRVLLPTGQTIRSAGVTVSFPGRPVDLALSPDRRTLYVKDNRGVVVIDTAQWSVRSQTNTPAGGTSAKGIAVSRDGGRVFVTNSRNGLCEGRVGADGKITWTRTIALPGPGGKADDPSYPCGLALSRDGKTAFVCLSRNNTLDVVDLEAGKVARRIPVGVAPYDVLLLPDGKTACVSNWGGRRAKPGERTAPSAGTQVVVDARGVAASGTVSFVDLASGRETAQARTGLHPTDLELSPDGRHLFVANANSHSVSVIDIRSRKAIEAISVRPPGTMPVGSAPNALALSGDGKTLYVALGGANSVAVVDLKGPGRSRSVVRGFIPTDWYPGSLALGAGNLFVANVKGTGSRGAGPASAKREVYEYSGTVSRIPLPYRFASAAAPAAAPSARPSKKPVPVPARPGDPSVFEHVVYIIKENKTYDQVLGDMEKGNGDASLCVFGREVTPNHHALAEQFILLDNYYCNGVCSADGHSWSTEGNVTDYLEKAFGGFTRSYTFGDDPLTYTASGFIWDNALEHGKTFRNYGEMDYAEPANGESWNDIYQDFVSGRKSVRFKQVIGVERLKKHTAPESIGWNMGIPDVVRADAFLREFREFERNGGFPNFTIIYLPNDHTSGGGAGVPEPRAQVADNDLALGQVVEAISKSRFWPKTCIFVIEDDPQSGFDHVDGHRSFCLVISPYTKRGAVLSRFYNQTSVLHTMERILGLPPMNEMDASAPLMTECFTSKPDLRPYTCLPNIIPLDQGLKKATAAVSFPLDRPDAIDDDAFNRAVWASVKGPLAPYPEEYAGAHGKGLAALGLRADATAEEWEDD